MLIRSLEGESSLSIIELSLTKIVDDRPLLFLSREPDDGEYKHEEINDIQVDGEGTENIVIW